MAGTCGGRFYGVWHDFWRIDGRRIQYETINGPLLNGLSGAKVSLPLKQGACIGRLCNSINPMLAGSARGKDSADRAAVKADEMKIFTPSLVRWRCSGVEA